MTIDQQELVRPGTILKTAPKITKETCHIDWKDKTVNIHNLVRGLSPSPAARTEGQKPDGQILTLQIYGSTVEIRSHTNTPGTVLTDHQRDLKIAAADGFLHILALQQAGKKRMSAAEFLRGNRDIDSYKF
jgi:methionyl-tRNA formyltransferase